MKSDSTQVSQCALIAQNYCYLPGAIYLTIVYMSYIFGIMFGVKCLNYAILKFQILQELEPPLHKRDLSAEIQHFAYIPANKNGRHSRKTYVRWNRWFLYLTCIIYLSLVKLPHSLKAPLIFPSLLIPLFILSP